MKPLPSVVQTSHLALCDVNLKFEIPSNRMLKFCVTPRVLNDVSLMLPGASKHRNICTILPLTSLRPVPKVFTFGDMHGNMNL